MLKLRNFPLNVTPVARTQQDLLLTVLSPRPLLEADVERFERAIPAALGKHTDVSFTKGVWSR